MHQAHIIRILAILGDPKDWGTPGICDHPTARRLRYYQDPTSFTNWKWLLREIGKRNCIEALLQFTETAMYISQTPLPPQDSSNCEPYESLPRLEEKLRLVTVWLHQPTRANRLALAKVAPKSDSYPRLYYLASAAAAFMNALVGIIVIERKYPSKVWSAFYLLGAMGYSRQIAELLFRRKVAEIYREKLTHVPPVGSVAVLRSSPMR